MKQRCPDCGGTYKDLSNHKVCHKRGSGKYADKPQYVEMQVCPDCGKSFKNLANHKICHGRRSRVDDSFRYNNILLTHTPSPHQGINPYFLPSYGSPDTSPRYSNESLQSLHSFLYETSPSSLPYSHRHVADDRPRASSLYQSVQHSHQPRRGDQDEEEAMDIDLTASLDVRHRRPRLNDDNVDQDEKEAIDIDVAARLDQEQTTGHRPPSKRASEREDKDHLRLRVRRRLFKGLRSNRKNIRRSSLRHFKAVMVANTDKHLMKKELSRPMPAMYTSSTQHNCVTSLKRAESSKTECGITIPIQVGNGNITNTDGWAKPETIYNKWSLAERTEGFDCENYMKEEIRKRKRAIEKAKLAVHELITFDEREQKTKKVSAKEVRHLSDEIEAAEEELRRKRITAFSVSAVSAAVAFVTFGASVLVSAVAAAVATVAAVAMLSFFNDSTNRKSAQLSINCYTKILKDYKAALKRTSTLQEKSNGEVLKTLVAVQNEKRKHLLRKFLEDAGSVGLNEDFRVKYGRYEVNFDEFSSMLFFKILFNFFKKDREHVCRRLRSIADQIEQYEIFEEVK